MAFVNNTTLGWSGRKASAATLWVTYPAYPRSDKETAYIVKDDIYDCSAGKISHQRVRSYDLHNHLLAETVENPGLAAFPTGNTLAGLVVKKICGGAPTVQGAENDVQTAVFAAFSVLILSAPKTGKYAFPRPPQPLTIGYYPFGTAPLDHIAIPPDGAYRIPAQGQDGSVLDVYRAADGHAVFYYYRKDGISDFYDTQTGRNLFPAQARAMAHSPGGWLGEKLRPSGLRKLESGLVPLARPMGKDVKMDQEGARACAYSAPMTVSVNGVPDKRIILFRKRKSPMTRSSPNGPDLRLRYDNVFLNFVAADDNGFFAHSYDLLALIHFDWNGRSAFFSGQDDVIAMPYNELSKTLNFQNSGEAGCPDQAGVNRAEALIAHYGRLQMKQASPLSSVR
ncbi:MAG TPA: hypothetical protein VGH23_19070 [Rhizomicrobium sp.]